MSQNQNNRLWILVALVIGLLLIGGFCCVGWFLYQRITSSEQVEATPEAPPEQAFTVAYSPEKAQLFQALVASFNAEVAAPSDEILPISAVEYEPDLMVEAALDGKLQALSPDSSIWLDTPPIRRRHLGFCIDFEEKPGVEKKKEGKARSETNACFGVGAREPGS